MPRIRSHVKFLIASILIIPLFGCGADFMPLDEPPEKRGLKKMSYGDLPGWNRDPVSQAAGAMETSCRKMLKKSDGRLMGAALGHIADWRPACEALFRMNGADDAAFRQFLESRFTPWQVTGNDDPNGMFTGYYEPILRGSPVKTKRYATPLYKVPRDQVTIQLGDLAEKAGPRATLKGRVVGGRLVPATGSGKDVITIDLSQFQARRNRTSVSGRIHNKRLVPYHDRAAIEKGALAGKGLELVWVDDPVEAFFLEIQGSGRVEMTNGRVIKVGYHGQNGHKYFAIGRELIQRDIIDKEDMSMQKLKAWLRKNPRQGRALMRKNRSYVFFRELPGKNSGPIGAQEVALTPGRSLAVDRRYLALGTPVWVDTSDPVSNTPIQKLVIAQDTGGAIKGAVRGDLFWGHGDGAEQRAGLMRQEGKYWILLPNSVQPDN